MADIKPSGLPNDTSIDGNHYVILNDPTGPTTKRTTLATIQSWLQSLTGWITTAMLANASVTGSKIASISLNSQEDTTNTAQTTAKIQSGWGQVLGTGATSISETVTFPVAVTTVLSININLIGFKSGGTAAANITQFNTAINSPAIIEAYNITTTGFAMKMSSSGAMGAAYHGYSWSITYL